MTERVRERERQKQRATVRKCGKILTTEESR